MSPAKTAKDTAPVVRLLHTSDWHVGKAVRGRSRIGEHEAVLAEIAAVADEHDVDVVLVVGDLFETASPPPEAERVVYRALLELSAGGGRPVVVVSGNHDNARRLQAVAPVFAGTAVHVQTTFAPPEAGGVLALERRGIPVRLALLPFLSQRHVVSAADLMADGADQHGMQYATRYAQVVRALAGGFEPDAVNLFVAHVSVVGGALGGGERLSQTVFDYSVPAGVFEDCHYVALGHLHRAQRIDAPAPVHYSGSPLQLDFGEDGDAKSVNLVEARPGAPARVTTVPLTSGRRFRTVAGSLAELEAVAGSTGDDFLRVVVHEPWRIGLADDVRELLPEAVDVRIDAPELAGVRTDGDDGVPVAQRSPHELFEAYLAERGIAEPRLLGLFDELLHDDLSDLSDLSELADELVSGGDRAS